MEAKRNQVTTSELASSAEAFYIEGSEALISGNRAEAINQFCEAIKRAPKEPRYYIALAEAMASEPDEIADAENLLQGALKMFPKNLEVQEKLAQLQKLSTAPAAAPADAPAAPAPDLFDSQSPDRATLPSEKIECQRCKQPNEPNAKNCYRCQAPLNLMQRIARWNRLREQAIQALPKTLSGISITILILIGLGTIAAVLLTHHETKIRVELVQPAEQAELKLDQLEFRWKSSQENPQFMFEIIDHGQKVVQHFTREPFYVLSKEEVKALKKGGYYQWHAIPVSAKYKVNYIVKDRDFRILADTKPAAAASPVPTTAPTPKPGRFR